MKLPLSSILVDRENRQRADLTKIEELAESIKKLGLINPIVVTKIDNTYHLVAGERRFTAVTLLGWTEVPVTLFESLDPKTQHLIELEENIKRVDLSWQDEARAVQAYYNLLKDSNPDVTLDETASGIGLSESYVRKRLIVTNYLHLPEVSEQKEFSTAFNYAMRKEERKKADSNKGVAKQIAQIISGIAPTPSPSPELPDEPEETRPPAEIINADFHTWAVSYEGPPFNLIHCDFPYGEATGDKVGQSAAKLMGTYDDSRETYDRLLHTLAAGGSWLSHSAHLVFWLSFARYFDTAQLLEAHGWRVNQRPLIWHKTDNSGIIPDANRGPRWVGEYAIFASKGDRKIVRAVANIVGAGTTREYHTSEKPRVVVDHFFRMIVDENTRLLDPTCGSGNAVRVASELGAEYSLGLELNPQFALTAQENLERRQRL